MVEGIASGQFRRLDPYPTTLTILGTTMAGMGLVIVGGLMAGIHRLWDPVRLLYIGVVVLAVLVGMISCEFLVMVRVDDSFVPREIFGVLNTLLFFQPGAVYPIEGFPWWLRRIPVIEPFTYTVDARRNLTLKNTGIEEIYRDVLILTGFSAVMIAGIMALFKRQLLR
jgi:ABC-type polysaccharide/polyol phosphate export permease